MDPIDLSAPFAKVKATVLKIALVTVQESSCHSLREVKEKAGMAIGKAGAKVRTIHGKVFSAEIFPAVHQFPEHMLKIFDG